MSALRTDVEQLNRDELRLLIWFLDRRLQAVTKPRTHEEHCLKPLIEKLERIRMFQQD